MDGMDVGGRLMMSSETWGVPGDGYVAATATWQQQRWGLVTEIEVPWPMQSEGESHAYTDPTAASSPGSQEATCEYKAHPIPIAHSHCPLPWPVALTRLGNNRSVRQQPLILRSCISIAPWSVVRDTEPRPLTAHPATVNDEAFSRHVIASPRREEDDRALKVRRGAPPARRDALEDLARTNRVGDEGLVHLSKGQH